LRIDRSPVDHLVERIGQKIYGVNIREPALLSSARSANRVDNVCC